MAIPLGKVLRTLGGSLIGAILTERFLTPNAASMVITLGKVPNAERFKVLRTLGGSIFKLL